MKQVGRKALIGIVVAWATVVPSTANAGTPAGVRCGSVIKKDAVLKGDLNCKGNGVKIGAHGVTLDLGGHSIVGAGRHGTKGIENPGYDDVTITNGDVTGFDWGIELRKKTKRNFITQMRVSGDRYGLVLFNSDDNVVDSNIIEASFDRSGGSRNGPSGAIYLHRSHGNHLEENRSFQVFTHVIVLFESHRNTIQETVATEIGSDGTFGTGLMLLNSDHNGIAENLFAENLDDGIFIDKKSTGNRLADNLAVNNGKFGINVLGEVIDGGGNRAYGNGFSAQCRGIRCGK
jgi:parallel beta-helix repeat protein